MISSRPTAGSISLPTLARLAILVVGCALAPALLAAPLQPPLQALRHPNVSLVSAELEPVAAEAAAAGLTVRVHEVLRGPAAEDGPGLLHLLATDADRALLVPGQRFLLAYSDVHRVPFKVRKEVRRADRRILLHIDGANPAIFPDQPAMRALLDPAHHEREAEAGYRERVLKGLRDASPAMVDLWTAELILRPGTFPRLSRAESRLLRRVVEDPAQRVSARARLLRSATERAPDFGGRWFSRAAGSLLEATPPAALATLADGEFLLLTALQTLQVAPRRASAAALERWLAGPPVLAENAALALRALGGDRERAAIERALLSTHTPETTRRMLSTHLERLPRKSGNASS